MNYRHAFHAGNFADVAKHLALIAVLLHLRRKDAGFAVIDTHAGRGSYDLDGEESRRTAEAESGVRRLTGHVAAAAGTALSWYVDLTRTSTYPGSPLIAARLLRPQDRLVAIEKHPEEYARLTTVLRPFRRTHAEAGDGYARLPALLPPPERRGLILIDPPYESEGEFSDAANAFSAAFRRFATGIYMIWFPIKSAAEANRFCGEILSCGPEKALRLDVSRAASEDGRLSSAGLLVINPPWKFDNEMREAMSTVLPLLSAEISIRTMAAA